MSRRIRNLIKKYLVDTSGSIIQLTAVLMPLLLGMGAFGLDVSFWMMNKRDMQTAADAAAMAAIWEVVNGYEDTDVAGVTIPGAEDVTFESYPEYAAIRAAISNGYNPGLGTIDIVFTEDNERAVVTIEQQENRYFSSMVFDSDVSTVTMAAAELSDVAGGFCLLALSETAPGAVRAVGTVDVDAAGCGIAINSVDDEALDLSGSVAINIADLNIVGDMDVNGSVDLDYDSLATGASPVPDPYEDLEVPSYSGCDYTNFSLNGGGTMSPGVYCGGVTITGTNVVDMDPGTYIMDCGNFDVIGNGELNGDGVSIVLTCSTNDDYGNIDIAGGREISLSAPALDEEMEGVIVYRDRDAPSSSQCNKVVGTAGIILDGAVYIPSDCFRIGGDSEGLSPSVDPCTQIIASEIELHGNPFFSNACDGSSAEELAALNVRLVL